jgi:hypothetical protein
MLTARSASALSRLPRGAHVRIRRATCAAARTEEAMRLVVATAALVTLALGLGSAVRSATQALDHELSRPTVASAGR